MYQNLIDTLVMIIVTYYHNYTINYPQLKDVYMEPAQCPSTIKGSFSIIKMEQEK